MSEEDIPRLNWVEDPISGGQMAIGKMGTYFVIPNEDGTYSLLLQTPRDNEDTA